MASTVSLGSTWSDGVAAPATQMRLGQGAAFAGSGSVTAGGRGGVVRHADTSLSVTVNVSDVITVQPGSAIVPGNAVSASGVWIASLPAATTITLDPRHVTNPRVDLVVVRQLDVDVVPTHGIKAAQIEVITGTPDPSPGVPALPSMAVEIARVQVYPAGGATSVVDRSNVPYATGLGGTYMAASLATLPAGVPKWSTGRALDSGIEYLYDGTSWTTAAGGFKQAMGSVTLSAGGAQPSSKTVTLPVGLFSSPPRVFLQPETNAVTATNHNFWVDGRTSSQFVANMTRTSTTTITYSWFAVGS